MKKLIIPFLLFLFLAAWAGTGRADNSDPPMERVPLKKARLTVLRKFPGKIRDFEFEQRKHKWVYAFKVAGKDQRMHFVVVDAVSGKIVAKTSEPLPRPKATPASTEKAVPTEGKKP